MGGVPVAFSAFICYIVNDRSITGSDTMTKTEIIEAAYRVWGRELYLNTSLSDVASELGVCKPALYRHFINKHALLEAMTRHFFDDFAGFIQADYVKALKNEDTNESIFILIRSVAEY